MNKKIIDKGKAYSFYSVCHISKPRMRFTLGPEKQSVPGTNISLSWKMKFGKFLISH